MLKQKCIDLDKICLMREISFKKHDDQLKNFKKKLLKEEHDHQFSGHAFISFQKMAYVNKVIDDIDFPWYKRLCCMRETHDYKGNKIVIKRAYEPTDINWENLGVDVRKVRCRKRLSNLVSLTC